MTMLEIRVPVEQEGTRSQVLRWLKGVGDVVHENEPLVELETDKVNVEVAAPAAGVLREILKREQDELAPGEILGRIEAGASATRQEAPTISAVSPLPRSTGEGQSGGISTSLTTSTQLSPAVRRLLNEKGLAPAAVRGTGQGGRITVEDVLRHCAAPAVVAPATTAGRLIPHSPIRTRVAEHMVQSLLRTAPHVTSVFEADMSAVIAHRAKHRDDFERRGTPLTLTAYFILAAIKAIRAVPEANSRWTDTALDVFDHIDIGIATALEKEGLVVPVLRNVETRDLASVASGLHDLVTRARENRLTPADMRGGTFTISNHGVSGSLIATPIVIHQPQSAILGIGKLEKRPVVAGDDRIVVRPRCYVTLTIDHRVMDGLQANRFLEAFVRSLHSDFQ